MQISSSQNSNISPAIDVTSIAKDAASSSSFADTMSAKQLTADKPTGAPGETKANKDEAREAFNNFVGQTLFSSLLKSMRSTVGKPAYFHGGRAEEIFQSQLDNVITDNLTESSAKSYADPMYDLFQLNRK